MIESEVIRKITVNLVDQELAFTPEALNIFRSGRYSVTIHLEDSVPQGIKFEKPYILFPLGSPFSVKELAPDGRTLFLEGLNNATSFIEPYPYRLVLGPNLLARMRTSDPSIINHGMEGRERGDSTQGV